MARQLVIELVGKADKYTKTLSDAEQQSKKFGDKISDVGGKITSAGAKMTAFTTVPILGFLGAATKAAAEDADAQHHLEKTLQNVGETHKNVLGAVNDYIAGAMKASTFTDDELRPSFEHLVTTTGSAERAMDLLDVAMDVAAGKGIDLETATKAVAKASEGQFAAVNKLVPGLLDLNDKTLTAESATKKLSDLFSGQASAATETAAGKAKMMARDMGELTEQLGSALVPVLSTVVGVVQPLIDKFMGLDGTTQKVIVVIGLAVAAIGPMITAIGALTTAVAFLAANPIVLAIAAVAAFAAGLVVLYHKSETFRNLVDTAFRLVKDSVQSMWRTVEPILSGFWGLLNKIWDIAGKVAGPIGNIIGKVGGIVGKIPGFATGGVVPGTPGMPQLAVVHGGERISSLRDQASGGGSGGGLTVNVSGVGMGRDFGLAVAEAIRDNGLYGVA